VHFGADAPVDLDKLRASFSAVGDSFATQTLCGGRAVAVPGPGQPPADPISSSSRSTSSVEL
ncbi:hypothetical protein ACWC2K_37425, partial [Streptomyces chattanoogensis]